MSRPHLGTAAFGWLVTTGYERGRCCDRVCCFGDRCRGTDDQ